LKTFISIYTLNIPVPRPLVYVYVWLTPSFIYNDVTFRCLFGSSFVHPIGDKCVSGLVFRYYNVIISFLTTLNGGAFVLIACCLHSTGAIWRMSWHSVFHQIYGYFISSCDFCVNWNISFLSFLTWSLFSILSRFSCHFFYFFLSLIFAFIRILLMLDGLFICIFSRLFHAASLLIFLSSFVCNSINVISSLLFFIIILSVHLYYYMWYVYLLMVVLPFCSISFSVGLMCPWFVVPCTTPCLINFN